LASWQSVAAVAAFFFFSFLIIYCTEFYTKDLPAVFSSKKLAIYWAGWHPGSSVASNIDVRK